MPFGVDEPLVTLLYLDVPSKSGSLFKFWRTGTTTARGDLTALGGGGGGALGEGTVAGGGGGIAEESCSISICNL